MTDTIKVITNNVPRDIIEAYELTQDERDQFDYINWWKVETGETGASFIRYKGELYDLGDTESLHDLNPAVYASHRALVGWHGIVRDSYFSGVLFKFVDQDSDMRVVCGRYYT
jgi:hypothetical protein